MQRWDSSDSKCFLKTEDQKIAKQLQSLGGFPKKVKFVKYEVLNREIINESEVNLRVRELGEMESYAGEAYNHFISTVLVKYHRTSNGWKVQSYTTESVKKARKVGDKYVSTE